MGYLANNRAWGINLCARVLVSFTLRTQFKALVTFLEESSCPIQSALAGLDICRVRA
jgi:hypothetical protein